MMNGTIRSTPWFLVLFYFMTFQSDGVADGPLKGDRKLIVREVCRITDAEKPYLNGSLTFDGKGIIVVEPHRRLSLFSVKDLKETVISENPLIVGARSDSATGGFFITMASEKIGSKDEGKQYLKFFDLLYFENTNDLLNWKPKWTKSRLAINTEKGGKELYTQWIPGIRQFCLFHDSNNVEYSFIDQDGKDVGNVKLPGALFGGFDSSDEGVEAYFISNDRQRPYLTRGVLSNKQDKLLKSERLYPFPFRGPYSYSFVGRQRLRGLRQGDVRRLVELVNQPRHNQHKDHENIGLESVHLDSLKFSALKAGARIGEFGMLSYTESPNEYAVVPLRENILSRNTYLPSFAYRRAGDLIMLPMYSVVDAVLSDETWVVSMHETVPVGKSQIGSRFFVCTLGDSH